MLEQPGSSEISLLTAKVGTLEIAIGDISKRLDQHILLIKALTATAFSLSNLTKGE